MLFQNRRLAWLTVAFALTLISLSPVIATISTAPPPCAGCTPILLATINCGNPRTITIANSQFGESSGTVHPYVVAEGTTVIWKNADSIQHTMTSDTGVWTSPILEPGQSFSFTFVSPGTFQYHCLLRPMTVGIIVLLQQGNT